MSSTKSYTAIFLAAFIIFPFLSVDDDLACLQTLNINATDDDSMSALARTPGIRIELQLDRMLEEHDTFQVTTLYAFAFALSFSALVSFLVVSPFRRELP